MNSRTDTLSTFRGATAAFRFAIVVSRFNPSVTSRLLKGAERCLKHHHLPKKNWEVFYCPGAFELPLVADLLAAQKRWDGVICLGAIIRGETPHFKYVSAETARGIQQVALLHSLPVIFGVLTTDTMKQAMARAGGSQGDKGWDAAVAALEMASLIRTLKKNKKRKK